MGMSSLMRKITTVPLSVRAIANPRRRILAGSVTKSLISGGENHRRLVHTSESFVPLSLGAIATPRRILAGSVTKSLISGEEHGIVHRRKSFVINSNQYFSTFTDVVANFKKRFDRKVIKLLKSDNKRLKPAIRLPQPPADFPFKIHDTPGEDGIRLTRELPGENILIQVWYIDDDQSTEDSSFFGDFLSMAFFPFRDEDYDDFHKLKIKFSVRIPKEKGSKKEPDRTELRITAKGKRIEFCESMDSDVRKHWGEYLAIRGYDEDVLRFLIVYMVRRNKLNRLLRQSEQQLDDFIKTKNEIK